MKEASNALRWCVAEMDRRYALMAALGVRNFGGYKSSGLGRELGEEGLQDYLEFKSINLPAG